MSSFSCFSSSHIALHVGGAFPPLHFTFRQLACPEGRRRELGEGIGSRMAQGFQIPGMPSAEKGLAVWDYVLIPSNIPRQSYLFSGSRTAAAAGSQGRR